MIVTKAISTKATSLACCVLFAGSAAFAQGNSGAAPGQKKDKRSGGSLASQSAIASPTTAITSTSGPASSAAASLYYGSWLDDASVVEPGAVWVGLSTGYWAAEGSRQIDAPVVSTAVGVTRYLQVGGSLPIYHFRDATGLSETGVGNIVAYSKLVLADAATSKRGLGFAIAPLVEIATSGDDRFGWALPLNVEKQMGPSRVYGSGGYFSRGSVFATIGAQIPVNDRIAITGTFGQSYARAGTHQTAVGVGSFLTVTPTGGVFVGIGRTFQPTAAGPGGVSVGGGFSVLLPGNSLKP